MENAIYLPARAIGRFLQTLLLVAMTGLFTAASAQDGQDENITGTICDMFEDPAISSEQWLWWNELEVRLISHAARLGADAREIYDRERFGLRVDGQGGPGPVNPVCERYPQFCPERAAPGRDPLCVFYSGRFACDKAITVSFEFPFDEAVKVAQEAARDLLDSGVGLQPRSTLESQIAATVHAATRLPKRVAKAIAIHALALELQEEAADLWKAYRGNRFHQNCADDIVKDYDAEFSLIPDIAIMRDDLKAAINGLRNFGLPSEHRNVSVTTDPAANLRFFAPFETDVASALGVAEDLAVPMETLRQKMIDSDVGIRSTSTGIPPAPGFHFTIMWFGSELTVHHNNAMREMGDIGFNLAAFREGLALLRGGLTQFPPGRSNTGGGGIGGLGLGIDTFCEGISGRTATFAGMLDDEGSIEPFLNEQDGLLRGDALNIVDSVLICALRWTLKDAFDLLIPTFVQPNTLQVELSQHPTQMSEFRRTVTARRAAYFNAAIQTLNNIREIEQATP